MWPVCNNWYHTVSPATHTQTIPASALQHKICTTVTPAANLSSYINVYGPSLLFPTTTVYHTSRTHHSKTSTKCRCCPCSSSRHCMLWHHWICQMNASWCLTPITNYSHPTHSHVSCHGPKLIWVAVHSLLPVLGCGQRCKLHCIYRIIIITSGICWRHISLTEVATYFSGTIYKFYYLLTYLLIYKIGVCLKQPINMCSNRFTHNLNRRCMLLPKVKSEHTWETHSALLQSALRPVM